MLPLDGVPQFTVLLLSMGFSVYAAQFIHRLEDLRESPNPATRLRERANRYLPWLRATLCVFMVDNLAILFRIGLGMYGIGDLALDLAIVSLIFLANALLTIISVMSYLRRTPKILTA